VFHCVFADTKGFGQGIAGVISQGKSSGFQLFGSHGVFHLGPPFFDNPVRASSSPWTSNHNTMKTPFGLISQATPTILFYF
jgi:hypothetical protein